MESEKAETDQQQFASWAINNSGNSVGFLCFYEGHWILAFYFFKIARNMPRVIDQSLGPVKSYKCLYWTGLALNAIFPITQGVFWMIWYKEYYIDGATKQWVTAIGDVTFFGMGVFLIASGFVLVWAVLSIRSFLKSHENEKQQINTRILLIHVCAFSLFLVSEAINGSLALLDMVVPKLKVVYLISNIVLCFCSFLSQCLICVIFWQVSGKLEQKIKQGKLEQNIKQGKLEQNI